MSYRRLVLSISFWALVAGLVAALGAVMGPSANANSDHFVAATDNGPVRGLQTETMKKFLGIPYAAPPVGDLRWRAPQPAAPWMGVRDATQFANHCPQPATFMGAGSTTEDCLYLNVYTPAGGWHTGQGHPVMVWIHGGALVGGASDYYDPTKFVENEDVVVVTINYRLGILGYLAHQALSAESPDGASGNYGFMDQQAALEWVQRNIKNFGGDPDNVTIFGESSGGLSVHMQLASPLAAGLFDRAIIESGAYQLNTASLATAETRGSTFAGLMGCSNQPDVAACLRALPVSAFLAASLSTLAGQIAAPNVDGKVLEESIGTALQYGRFNRVPVMEGSNHDEWRLFVAASFELPTGIATNTTNYRARVDASFNYALSAIPFPPVPGWTVLDYVVNVLYPPIPISAPGPSIALGVAGTDGIFACNSRKSIRLMANFVPVFACEFNDQTAPMSLLPPPVSGMPYGAYHAAEIPYIFNVPGSTQNPLSPSQELLSRDMVSYWGHFARFGDPNSSSTPFWPQYDPAADQFQSLNLPDPTTESGFAAAHKCSFWTKGI